MKIVEFIAKIVTEEFGSEEVLRADGKLPDLSGVMKLYRFYITHRPAIIYRERMITDDKPVSEEVCTQLIDICKTQCSGICDYVEERFEIKRERFAEAFIRWMQIKYPTELTITSIGSKK